MSDLQWKIEDGSIFVFSRRQEGVTYWREPLNSECATIVARLRADLALAQKVIAWANNSLFGSHGFFLSLRGDLPPNEHHLDTAIEDLKKQTRDQYADLSRMREALAQVSALCVHEAEPIGDVNTDDTQIAFADGAWFGRWEAARIARAALSPAQKGEA